MRLGQALCRVAAVHPHFFNSFYRRVRVVREAPRPMPAAAMVDVTHVCSLRCPFCIAAGVLGSREMPVETFAAVSQELAGIGRMTLVGGEPFQHSSPGTLCRLARKAAAEVEVFTNGLVLGTAPAEAGQRLREPIPEASSDWLAVVLSVDPDHASRMPAGRLDLAVQGLLQAERDGVCRARFSVTHTALRTGSYLDTDTLLKSMEGISPTLARLFPERLMEGRIQDTFYFNSVICGEVGGGERLRLEDLVFSPEIAISFDLSGKPVVFGSLAAMWAASPPPGTVLGDLGQAGAALLRRADLDNPASTVEPVGRDSESTSDGPPSAVGAVAPAAPTADAWARAYRLASSLGDTSAQDRLLRCRSPFAHFMEWDGGATLVSQRADRLHSVLAAGIGGISVQAGGEEGGDGLDTAVLAALLERMCRRPAWRAALVSRLSGIVRNLLAGPDGQPLCPMYSGDRELLGMRVPLAPGEMHPLDRVHLPGEEGFGERDELVLRPRLHVMSDSDLDVELPGLTAVPSANEAQRTAALVRLLSMVAALAGPEVTADVESQIGGHLSLPLPRGRGFGPPAPLRLAGVDDPAAAFAACTFDRNRQRADEENPELLALVLAGGQGRFPDRPWSRFVAAALTWMEQVARNAPLGPAAGELLAGLVLKGESAKRLKRLITAPGTTRTGGNS